MKSSNQYVQNIRNGMRNFRNAGGAWGLQNSPNQGNRKPAGWNAGGGANALPSADPIILTITNNTAAAVTDFPIFGAAEFLNGNNGGGSWSSAGDFTLRNVTISSGYSAVSYQQILDNTRNNPFAAGSVYLESISGNAQQVSDVYQLTSVTNDGTSFTKPIKPYKDTMQLNSTATYNNKEFNIGSMTKMTWRTIYASAVFQISIWPYQEINPSQALNRGNVNQQFARPQIVGNMRSNNNPYGY